MCGRLPVAVLALGVPHEQPASDREQQPQGRDQDHRLSRRTIRSRMRCQSERRGGGSSAKLPPWGLVTGQMSQPTFGRLGTV